MLRLCVCLLLVVCVASLGSARQNIRDFVKKVNQKSVSSKDILDHPYVKSGRVSAFVRAGRKGEEEEVMIEVEGSYSQSGLTYSDLADAGCIVNKKFENAQIFTGSCPGPVVEDHDLHVPHKAQPFLYESVRYFFGDNGSPDDFSTKGEGVIVGIVDTGVDVFHADFADYAGNTRVTKYWLTSQDTTTDVVDTGVAVCRNVVCDPDGHGTHVASTAAGRFGVAPKAEIWAAQIDFSSVSIQNAVFGMIEMAQQVGKPIVINLSLGSEWHSHTGRDINEQFLTLAVTDDQGDLIPGVAIAVAAGNSGSTNQHYNLDIAAGATSTFTAQYYTSVFEEYSTVGGAIFTVSTSSDVSISAQVISGGGPFQLETSNTDDWGADLDGEHAVGGIDFTGADMSDEYSTVTFTVTNNGASDIKVHSWVLGYDGWAYGEGDNDSTSSNYCCPGISICVGSITSKNSVTPAYASLAVIGDNSVVGERTPFSSQGPRVFTDVNEIKPDIAAPGHYIVAAYSGALAASPSTEALFPDVTSDKYMAISGTSMATPHVTGGIALLFQVDPSLTQVTANSALRNSASISSSPDNQLGYGSVLLADSLNDVGYTDEQDVCDSASVSAAGVAATGFTIDPTSLCVEHLLPSVAE